MATLASTRPLDLVADFPAIPSGWAYLDTAATAQKPKPVIDAITRGYAESYATVHRGVYQRSADMTLAFEASRHRVARFINAPSPDEIIFVRGATEAINLVAHSWGNGLKPGDRILLSTLEHHSNIVPWQLLRDRTGIAIDVAPLTEDGRIDLDAVEAMLTPQHKLVALAHVSNVLGSVLDARRAANLAHCVGAKLLLDGCQAVPRLAVDVQALGCDFYAITGHKMLGPTGTGALWARREHLQAMPPFFGGGEMIREVSFNGTTFAEPPHKFEAGTPNIAGFAGLSAAMDYYQSVGFDAIHAWEERLLAYATERLRDIPGLRIIGEAKDKEPVISFLIEGAQATDLATLLDLEGVAVRSGHHCAHPLMQFYGVPATLRASLAFYNTREEIDAFITALLKVRKLLL